MHHHYRDILDRIAEPPKWWDEQGVPRFCQFRPRHCANVYADEAALVEIGCQNCDERFQVAFSCSRSTIIIAQSHGHHLSSLADRVMEQILHYGDPPNMDCCGAGATMNCNDIRVIEFWRRNNGFDWERVPHLERALADADSVVKVV